jgi:phytoene dehydrogenase-like protein
VAATLKPPATQRVYDVCVLGGGPGGAASAALLSRRGFRVLLVDVGGHGPAPVEGWVLPAVPSLAPSARQLPAAESLLIEMGLASDATRAQEPLVPDLQLLLPRHRLNLVRDPAALAAELRREWPADAARLVEGLARLATASEAAGQFLRGAPPLPPAGLMDRLALRSALKAAARASGTSRQALTEGSPLASLGGHPLAAGLLALARFLGHLDGPPSPLAVARLCGTALKGLHRNASSAPSLEEALRRRVAETRGQVIGSPAEPARVEAIGLDGARLSTVRVAGASDLFLARVFVLAAPAAWLLSLLPAEAAARGRARLPLHQEGHRLAALHLVVRPGGLPPGLGPAALVLPDGSSGDDAVLLEVAPARRSGAAGPDPGERLISAWTLAAPGSGPDPVAAARLEACLADLLPFSGRHLVCRAAPPPTPHQVVIREPTLGVARRPARSPWKNLLLAGREAVPGLGLEGELHAGLQAAAHAAALLGTSR